MTKVTTTTSTLAQQQAALLQEKAQRLLTQAGQLQQKAAKLQQQAKELVDTKIPQKTSVSPPAKRKRKRKKSTTMTQDAAQRIQTTAQRHPKSPTAQSQFDVRAQETASNAAWNTWNDDWDDDDWWNE